MPAGEAMDLDMTLEERISKRAVRGGGRGGRTGRVPANVPRKSPRSSPYSRESSAPDGKWGHSGFVEQNKIKGGALAARMLVQQPEEDSRDGENSSVLGQWRHDKYPGRSDERGGRRRRAQPAPPSHLAQRTLAALTGDGPSGRGRGDAGNGALPLGRPISVKGAGAATVEVRNLVPGTTAEDVAAIFGDTGAVLSSSEVDSRSSNSVSVQVKFASLKDAETAKAVFHGQVADGRTLEVVILDNSLLNRVVSAGIATPRANFDLLPDSSVGGGMRSDALLDDARSQVLTAPKIVPVRNQRGR